MGLVLKRAFKGTHCWIPPISQQIKCAERDQILSPDEIKKRCIEYDEVVHNESQVKIDAMFFACTEEPLELDKPTI